MSGTSKGWALGRDNRRNRSVARRIRIEAYKKATGLEIEKQIAGSCQITAKQGLALLEGSTPSKTKKRRLQEEEEPAN
jgi:hypothetical protein